MAMATAKAAAKAMATAIGHEAMAGRGLETDQRYLLICTSGRRSEAVCHTLREQGFGQVWTLTGGVRALPDVPRTQYCDIISYMRVHTAKRSVYVCMRAASGSSSFVTTWC